MGLIRTWLLVISGNECAGYFENDSIPNFSNKISLFLTAENLFDKA